MKFTRIICGNVADPSILVHNGKYYVVTSSFRYFPGLFLYESSDLVHWKKINTLLKKPVAGITDVWAPEICKIGNRFFVYFPADFEIYTVYTDDLYGEWSEPVLLGQHGMIDPAYIQDEKTGQNWLFFHGGNAAPLSADGLSVVGEVRKVYPVWDIPKEWEIQSVACESPKLFYRNGYYYMITAQGGTAGPATSHMAIMSRSRSLESGWEFSPYNPVIKTQSVDERWWSTGHATAFEDAQGEWHFILHGYENGRYNEGRQILLCDAEWTADGWLIAVDRKEHDVQSTVRNYDFNAISLDELQREFTFFDKFQNERIFLDNGALALYAQGTSINNSLPLLVNEISGDYEAIVELESIGNVTEFGLLLYYNENYKTGIFVKDGYIFSRWGLAQSFGEKYESNKIFLKLRKRNDIVSFFYSQDGIVFEKMRMSTEVSGYHTNVLGGYLSLRLGIYAAGNGRILCKQFKINALDDVIN